MKQRPPPPRLCYTDPAKMIAGPKARDYRKMLSASELLIFQSQGGRLTPAERAKLDNWQRSERLGGKKQDRVATGRKSRPLPMAIAWVPPKGHRPADAAPAMPATSPAPSPGSTTATGDVSGPTRRTRPSGTACGSRSTNPQPQRTDHA